MAQLFDALEALDVLVSCATDPAPASIEATTPEALIAALDARVYGSYWAAKHALPKMRAGGNIVFFSSGVPRQSRPDTSAQSMIDGAVEALTRALAVEAGAQGVRVNCVASGPAGADGPAADSVIETVMFLAQATHLTGAVIDVNESSAGLYA